MADVTITNSKIAALNDNQAMTLNAATETTDATAQKFIYTPTGKDNKICIVTVNGAASALTVTVTGGDGAFAMGDLTDTIPATAGTYIIQLETGRYMQSNGTIEISYLPAAGKDLVNDHALTVGVIELI